MADYRIRHIENVFVQWIYLFVFDIHCVVFIHNHESITENDKDHATIMFFLYF